MIDPRNKIRKMREQSQGFEDCDVVGNLEVKNFEYLLQENNSVLVCRDTSVGDSLTQWGYFVCHGGAR